MQYINVINNIRRDFYHYILIVTWGHFRINAALYPLAPEKIVKSIDCTPFLWCTLNKIVILPLWTNRYPFPSRFENNYLQRLRGEERLSERSATECSRGTSSDTREN